MVIQLRHIQTCAGEQLYYIFIRLIDDGLEVAYADFSIFFEELEGLLISSYDHVAHITVHMPFKLVDHSSIANQFIAELREVSVQNDRMRFRKNMERLGQIFAYEISKTFRSKKRSCETPLGVAQVSVPRERIVVASILRAGLPLHNGLLSFFDGADNAFVSAYRKHHKDGTFEISLEYATCPDLDGSILILADSMLATGASMEAALEVLEKNGTPKEIHTVAVIASVDGVNYLRRIRPKVHLWLGDLDDELTARSYIVPGLGDAGDLSYGAKMQD